MSYYGACNSELKLPAQVLAGCEASTVTITELTAALLIEQPKTDILFINCLGGSTQRLFYELVRVGIPAALFANRISAKNFFAEVNRMIDVYKSVSSRVTTFFVPGDGHVFFNSNGFYNVASTTSELLGAVMASWLEKLGGGGSVPTDEPTTSPPTEDPTTAPPTDEPTTAPPTEDPTTAPPTEDPTTAPPTEDPTTAPPTEGPTTAPPTDEPTTTPTGEPTTVPPTEAPTTAPPTQEPSTAPPTSAVPTVTPITETPRPAW